MQFKYKLRTEVTMLTESEFEDWSKSQGFSPHQERNDSINTEFTTF